MFNSEYKLYELKYVFWLTQQGNVTCHQSGNRKFHSTETLSVLVTGHIYKAMDKKEITAMVLIDLSKAFDSIQYVIEFSSPSWEGFVHQMMR